MIRAEHTAWSTRASAVSLHFDRFWFEGVCLVVCVCIWMFDLKLWIVDGWTEIKTEDISHSYNHQNRDPERHLFLSQTHPPPHISSSQPTTTAQRLRCLCGFLVRLRLLCVSQGLTVASMYDTGGDSWDGWDEHTVMIQSAWSKRRMPLTEEEERGDSGCTPSELCVVVVVRRSWWWVLIDWTID